MIQYPEGMFHLFPRSGVRRVPAWTVGALRKGLRSAGKARALRLDPGSRFPGFRGLGIVPTLLAASWLAGWHGMAGDATPWEPGQGYRSVPLQPPVSGRSGFRLIAPADSGVTFTNRLSDRAIAENRLREIGAGVALGDVDGDGRVDLYFCGSEVPNALYRNLGGGRFEDITEAAGVACPGQFSTGTALVDQDGDGDLDLFVNSLGGGTRLFLNDGRARFQEVKDRGLLALGGATTLAFGDVDADGDLDLYVANYRTDTMFDHPVGLKMEMRTQPDGSRVIEPRSRFVTLSGPGGVPQALERGEPHAFYINRGGGRYALMSWTTGLFVDEDGEKLPMAPTDWGLAAMFRDLNGDGHPDLYVCNDFVFWPDRIWINEGGRRFRALARTSMRCTSLASMAVDVADINRDGFDDLFVADMLHPAREQRAQQRPDTLRANHPWPLSDPGFRPEVPRNTLQLARGDGTYAEVALLAGVAATDWTPSAGFLDVDLDGWEDLLTLAGNLHDVQDADALSALGREPTPVSVEGRLVQLKRLPPRTGRSLAFRNRRDLTFEDATEAWGFGGVGVAQGMAFGDLDGDGDLEVVVNALNEPARIYRNESGAPRVAVRLRGARENTRGVGGRIRLSGGPVAQTQEIVAGGRFCSSDDPVRVFAAGSATNLTLEVFWRSGRYSLIHGVRPNRLYEVLEENAVAPPAPETPAMVPRFVSESLPQSLRHEGGGLDDFVGQPLLPRKFSTGAPGVGWVDLASGGGAELLVPGGRSTPLRRVGRGPGPEGRFTDPQVAPFVRSSAADAGMVLGWRNKAVGFHWVAVDSGWRESEAGRPEVRVGDFLPTGGAGDGTATVLSDAPILIGALAMADVDSDGELDLFVGGMTVPGRYPEPVPSWILRGEGGTLVAPVRCLERARVNGAVFSDLDGDGDADLALACDWDSIRVLRNEGGRFQDTTEAWGLANQRGWWTGIAAADFDGDGRMDLVAGNRGGNWRMDAEPRSRNPVFLYYGDFAESGGVQTVVASLDPLLGKVTPWRDRETLLSAMPFLAPLVPDHRTFGRAGVEELLGNRLARGSRLEAGIGESMVFLNRGNRFEAIPLPSEAQFSAVFGVSVADFDGDGNEDLFLAENFFGVDAESSRQDGGVGRMLLGDGTGRFRVVGPKESGISMPGEQRGAAVADFDGDGRVDLAVAQHAGPLRVFRNQGARPGVRVRLRGDAGNPDAIGASMRVRAGDRWGPRREVRAGGGWRSQDAVTQVLGGPAVVKEIEVRWPTGEIERVPWPEGVQGVEIGRNGKVLRWKE